MQNFYLLVYKSNLLAYNCEPLVYKRNLLVYKCNSVAQDF
jgi:hypothetical protein